MPEIDLVLLNYNDYQNCIKFLKRHRGIEAINHIIVVDNNSSDDSALQLKMYTDDKVELIQNSQNGGYASGNNIGYEYCLKKYKSEFIIISNPDVEFDEACVLQSVLILNKNPKLKICAPRMKNISGVAQPCAWDLTTWFRYAWETLPLTKSKKTICASQYENHSFVECDCVAGSFFIVSTKKIARNELFDPKTFLYCEETILGFLNGEKSAASISNTFFIHAHSQSISKTYKTAVRRQKLIWNSKMYVFMEYYKIGLFQRVVVNVIKLINLMFVRLRSFAG